MIKTLAETLSAPVTRSFIPQFVVSWSSGGGWRYEKLAPAPITVGDLVFFGVIGALVFIA